MYKDKALDGSSSIYGKRIKKFHERLSEKTSQKQFSDMLQIVGLDIDKNVAQRVGSGGRLVTDIELKIITRVLNVSYQGLPD